MPLRSILGDAEFLRPILIALGDTAILLVFMDRIGKHPVYPVDAILTEGGFRALAGKPAAVIVFCNGLFDGPGTVAVQLVALPPYIMLVAPYGVFKGIMVYGLIFSPFLLHLLVLARGHSVFA